MVEQRLVLIDRQRSFKCAHPLAADDHLPSLLGCIDVGTTLEKTNSNHAPARRFGLTQAVGERLTNNDLLCVVLLPLQSYSHSWPPAADNLGAAMCSRVMSGWRMTASRAFELPPLDYADPSTPTSIPYFAMQQTFPRSLRSDTVHQSISAAVQTTAARCLRSACSRRRFAAPRRRRWRELREPRFIDVAGDADPTVVGDLDPHHPRR